ncbi:MAG: hypothetical protein GXP47_06970 [Acidobacteria bacterium]|nr:hypothetical protein [Acidobacteriota bacterium]
MSKNGLVVFVLTLVLAAVSPVCAAASNDSLRAALLEALDTGALPAKLRGGTFAYPDPGIRRLAIRVLEVAGNPRDVANLARFVQDRDPSVQYEVMIAAARIGKPAANLIRGGLASSSPLVRDGAVWAAAQLGEELGGPLVEALRKEKAGPVLEVGLANLWRLPAGSWESLAVQHAGDKDPLLRRAAAYSLARSGAAPVRPLRRLAADAEPVIRATALRGLVRGVLVDADRAVVLRALGDPDWRVRAAACGVLAADRRAVPPQRRAALVDCVRSSWPALRVEAIRALGAHAEVPDEGELAAAVEGPEPWPASQALAAMARRGMSGVVERIGTWLASKDRWRRRAAAAAVPWVDGKPGNALEARVLAGDDGTILAWLEASDSASRLPAPQQLRSLLVRKDPAVRAQALDLLARREAVPSPAALLKLAKSWAGDTLPDARATAFKLALEGSPAEGRQEVLSTALKDPDWAVQAQLVWAARRLGLEAVLPPREARHNARWYTDLAEWMKEPHWIDLVTVRGTLRLKLDTRHAPITAREVWNLAREGFYDGLTFHRVVPNFVIQGGDPRGDGWGGPGFGLADEVSLMPFDSWRAGIATSGPDTGGCQVFVTLMPADHLTGHYTNFAELVRGHNVAERIQVGDVIRKVETASGSEPPPPVPYLVGKLSWKDLETVPGWKESYESYTPDPGAIKELRAATGSYRIVTVLGSWCSDSEREVPRLRKILDTVGGDHFKLDLVGVDHTLVVDRGLIHEGLLPNRKAERVPTIVVLDADGQELGRVVETAEMPLEKLIVEFLAPVEGW